MKYLFLLLSLTLLLPLTVFAQQEVTLGDFSCSRDVDCRSMRNCESTTFVASNTGWYFLGATTVCTPTPMTKYCTAVVCLRDELTGTYIAEIQSNEDAGCKPRTDYVSTTVNLTAGRTYRMTVCLKPCDGSGCGTGDSDCHPDCYGKGRVAYPR
jgi:hypothetical protein